MRSLSKIESQIREQFSEVLKEYGAFDRTLAALSSLSFILSEVKEIAQETEFADFRPRIVPADINSDLYTPDGVIISKKCDFVLELKTSWDGKDVAQVVKYAKSPGVVLRDGNKRSFHTSRCVLLGYQNPPGQPNLDSLFGGVAVEQYLLSSRHFSLQLGERARGRSAVLRARSIRAKRFMSRVDAG